ncbi:mitochondrial nuclease [Coprinopsis cinerea okayama7|uniref:Endonuclease n=1 Tax=Coprinopsis cinerea (strain Okayama-7 / 130 / ATCC MYA-4618 / FGSC 9003) TaxID=240176 RepID=A8NG01_COPC7|nr:mitochondrial nuclease [Coprinopsis cinerea okayama7\|eukprot:XP_001833442.2 mitochondrial nuclease [Coprinopsis cinerea okayama7\
MPTSAIIHTAVFTAGALVGGGIAAAISSKRNASAAPQPPPPAKPVIEVDGGRAKVSNEVAVVSTQILPPALRNGHPDLLVRRAYVAGYDRRLRHPSWTAEHITKASLAPGSSADSGPVDRSKSAFIEDESIPSPFRAKLQDYFRSGYDRGHMVPAADAKSSQEAMDETFLLTNIAPQVGDGFNRHYWAYLEDWCRRLTNTFQDVYVFTVPLYLPKLDPDGKYRITHEVIGSPPNISVPTHFAKVVLTSKPSSPSTPNIPELSLGAFVLPNAVIKDEAPLEGFVVPVEAVEKAAGLTLFSDQIKSGAKHICKTTKCEVIVRRFDDARKNTKAIATPKK